MNDLNSSFLSNLCLFQCCKRFYSINILVAPEEHSIFIFMFFKFTFFYFSNRISKFSFKVLTSTPFSKLCFVPFKEFPNLALKSCLYPFLRTLICSFNTIPKYSFRDLLLPLSLFLYTITSSRH